MSDSRRDVLDPRLEQAREDFRRMRRELRLLDRGISTRLDRGAPGEGASEAGASSAAYRDPWAAQAPGTVIDLESVELAKQAAPRRRRGRGPSPLLAVVPVLAIGLAAAFVVVDRDVVRLVAGALGEGGHEKVEPTVAPFVVAQSSDGGGAAVSADLPDAGPVFSSPQGEADRLEGPERTATGWAGGVDRDSPLASLALPGPSPADGARDTAYGRAPGDRRQALSSLAAPAPTIEDAAAVHASATYGATTSAVASGERAAPHGEVVAAEAAAPPGARPHLPAEGIAAGAVAAPLDAPALVEAATGPGPKLKPESDASIGAAPALLVDVAGEEAVRNVASTDDAADPRAAATPQPEVREAQLLLSALGYALDRTDGAPSRATDAALSAFSASERLADANVDPAFLAGLRAAQAGDAAALYETLDPEGLKAANVRAAQMMLILLGYEIYAVSGLEDATTTTAVERLVEAHGLADAHIDAALVALLKELSGHEGAPHPGLLADARTPTAEDCERAALIARPFARRRGCSPARAP